MTRTEATIEKLAEAAHNAFCGTADWTQSADQGRWRLVVTRVLRVLAEQPPFAEQPPSTVIHDLGGEG